MILDREEEYLYGLGEYFQERLLKFFDIYSFGGKDTLRQFIYEKKKEIDVFLGSEELSVQEIKEFKIKQYIYLSSGEQKIEGKEEVIYKYQCAEHILQEFLKLCHVKGTGVVTGLKRDTRFLGVYSPVGRCGKTMLALVMGQVLAQWQKVLYISLEEWPGFRRIIGEYDGMDLSDLIYFIKQDKKELKMYMNGMLIDINGLKLLPPVKKAPDIQEMKETELNMMMDKLQESGEYDVILVDVGNRVKNLFSLMERMERIYMPVLKDNASISKQEEFLEFLEISDYQPFLEKFRQCRLRVTETMEWEEIENLYGGSFGEFVQEMLKEDGFWKTEEESEMT